MSDGRNASDLLACCTAQDIGKPFRLAEHQAMACIWMPLHNIHSLWHLGPRGSDHVIDDLWSNRSLVLSGSNKSGRNIPPSCMGHLAVVDTKALRLEFFGPAVRFSLT